MAAPGDVISNGSTNYLTTELSFEPEVPFVSLKISPPTRNELEQLMDNPYAVTTNCTDNGGPIPGNDQGFPTYCTDATFTRRPSFRPGATLPPTGPYFHTGSKLTLRQVVDFYVRGGDFPITNSTHRDFNIINLNAEIQSNLSEDEKVALVDFLLELTDGRVRFERAPFDHPEEWLPLDGTAPENTFGRDGFAARTAGATCDGLPGSTGPCFRRVPASGAAGIATALTGFMGVTNVRNNPNCDPNVGPISHYCH